MSMMIGIDPHKATHTAVAIDGDEQPVARSSTSHQRWRRGSGSSGRPKRRRTTRTTHSRPPSPGHCATPDNVG